MGNSPPSAVAQPPALLRDGSTQQQLRQRGASAAAAAGGASANGGAPGAAPATAVSFSPTPMFRTFQIAGAAPYTPGATPTPPPISMLLTQPHQQPPPMATAAAVAAAAKLPQHSVSALPAGVAANGQPGAALLQHRPSLSLSAGGGGLLLAPPPLLRAQSLLARLPRAVVVHTLALLERRDTLSVMCINRAFHATLARDPAVWKLLFRRFFGDFDLALTANNPPADVSSHTVGGWHGLYRLRVERTHIALDQLNKRQFAKAVAWLEANIYMILAADKLWPMTAAEKEQERAARARERKQKEEKLNAKQQALADAKYGNNAGPGFGPGPSATAAAAAGVGAGKFVAIAGGGGASGIGSGSLVPAAVASLNGGKPPPPAPLSAPQQPQPALALHATNHTPPTIAALPWPPPECDVSTADTTATTDGSSTSGTIPALAAVGKPHAAPTGSAAPAPFIPTIVAMDTAPDTAAAGTTRLVVAAPPPAKALADSALVSHFMDGGVASGGDGDGKGPESAEPSPMHRHRSDSSQRGPQQRGQHTFGQKPSAVSLNAAAAAAAPRMSPETGSPVGSDDSLNPNGHGFGSAPASVGPGTPTAAGSGAAQAAAMVLSASTGSLGSIGSGNIVVVGSVGSNGSGDGSVLLNGAPVFDGLAAPDAASAASANVKADALRSAAAAGAGSGSSGSTPLGPTQAAGAGTGARAVATPSPPIGGSQPPSPEEHKGHAHPLVRATDPYKRGKQYRCDMCREAYSAPTISWHCAVCHYDECSACHAHSGSAEVRLAVDLATARTAFHNHALSPLASPYAPRRDVYGRDGVRQELVDDHNSNGSDESAGSGDAPASPPSSRTRSKQKNARLNAPVGRMDYTCSVCRMVQPPGSVSFHCYDTDCVYDECPVCFANTKSYALEFLVRTQTTGERLARFVFANARHIQPHFLARFVNDGPYITQLPRAELMALWFEYNPLRADVGTGVDDYLVALGAQLNAAGALTDIVLQSLSREIYRMRRAELCAKGVSQLAVNVFVANAWHSRSTDLAAALKLVRANEQFARDKYREATAKALGNGLEPPLPVDVAGCGDDTEDLDFETAAGGAAMSPPTTTVTLSGRSDAAGGNAAAADGNNNAPPPLHKDLTEIKRLINELMPPMLNRDVSGAGGGAAGAGGLPVGVKLPVTLTLSPNQPPPTALTPTAAQATHIAQAAAGAGGGAAAQPPSRVAAEPRLGPGNSVVGGAADTLGGGGAYKVASNLDIAFAKKFYTSHVALRAAPVIDPVVCFSTVWVYRGSLWKSWDKCYLLLTRFRLVCREKPFDPYTTPRGQVLKGSIASLSFQPLTLAISHRASEPQHPYLVTIGSARPASDDRHSMATDMYDSAVNRRLLLAQQDEEKKRERLADAEIIAGQAAANDSKASVSAGAAVASGAVVAAAAAPVASAAPVAAGAGAGAVAAAAAGNGVITSEHQWTFAVPTRELANRWLQRISEVLNTTALADLHEE